MKNIYRIAAIILAAISYPALAENFVHKPSGITVPDTVGGLPSAGTKAYYEGDLDFMYDYASDAKRSEIISIYVFRNVSGNASIWFDRASAAILSNRNLAGVGLANGPVAFQPAMQNNASGMRASYALQGSHYKSTAVAIAPVGEWYVKIRATSATRSPEEIDRWVDEVLASLGLIQPKSAAPDAVLIKACGDKLSFAKKAKAIKQNSEDKMMSAILGGFAASINLNADEPDGVAVLANAITWCREDYPIMPSGVYRANASKDSYLLALGDSGRAITAGIDSIAGLVTENKKQFGISYILPDKTLVFTPRNGLPLPEQALEVIEKEGVISSYSNIGGKNELTVDTE